MSSLPFCANSGIYFATGSFSRTSPFCTSCITAVVVATTLVRDAISKIVSSGHRLATWFERAIAESLAVDHLSVVPDQQDGARNLVVVDGIAHDGVEHTEAGNARNRLRWSCVRPVRAG